MEQQRTWSVTDVASCTIAAAHRRDHQHNLADEACHPHVTEVVLLGARAVCVCHDCGADSGFLPRREAEALAAGHRDRTRELDVGLLTA